MIKLAQDSEVINNLVESENKLQVLDQQANVLIDEYNSIAGSIVPNSFFNFDNIYFWVVLAGLLLLAFGLLFLLAELQYPAKQPEEGYEEEETEDEEEGEDEEEEEAGEEHEEDHEEEEGEDEEENEEAYAYPEDSESDVEEVEPESIVHEATPVPETKVKNKSKKVVAPRVKKSKKAIKIKVEKVK